MDKCLNVSKLYEDHPKLRKDDVEILLKWCQQQRHFPKVSELQTALALHACFYSVEQTKSCIENYFTIRTMVPDIFSSYNPEKDPALKEAMHVTVLAVLPQKTKEGYNIILTKLMDTNPDVYNPQIANKLFDMHAMRLIHTDGPGNGIVMVLDMKGGVFGHLTKINLTEYRKFLVYLQLIFHSNNDNLYTYIPKEAMPVDYGGKGESMDILFERSKNSIYDYQWFYDIQETNVVDESKRIGPRKNADSLFGFDGTFKKLEVD